MRVRVYEDRSGWHLGRRWADWVTKCDCGFRGTSSDWEGAMEYACGHLCFVHPRRFRPPWEITVSDGRFSTGPILALGT